jgi:hypothetical protein
MVHSIWPSQIESELNNLHTRTSFSDSPFHLLAKLEADTLKKILPFDTALAKRVLPVPGGPNKRTPLVALRIP